MSDFIFGKQPKSFGEPNNGNRMHISFQ